MDYKDMDLEDILKKYELGFTQSLVKLAITDKDLKQKFSKKLEPEQVKDLIISNKDKINKDYFMLLEVIYYYDEVNVLKDKIKEYKSKIKNDKNPEKAALLLNVLQERFEKKQREFKQLKELLKDFNYGHSDIYYVEENNDIQVDYLEAKDLLVGVGDIRKKEKRINGVLEQLAKVEDNNTNGLGFFLDVISPRGKMDIFENEQLGEVAYKYCMSKLAIREFDLDPQNIDEIKDNEELRKELIRKMNDSSNSKDARRLRDEYWEECSDCIGKFIPRVNEDLFLLRGAIGFETYLESVPDSTYIPIIKKSLEVVKSGIRTEKVININVYNGETLVANVPYSKQHIRNCLARISGDKYIKVDKIREEKSDVLTGVKTLDEIEVDLDVAFSDEELKQLIFSNSRNFEYLSEKLDSSVIISKLESMIKKDTTNIEKQAILLLVLEKNLIPHRRIYDYYRDGLLDKEVVEGLVSNFKEDNFTNMEELIKLYNNKKEQPKEYEKYKEYNKLIADNLMDNEDENGVKKYSENLMEYLAESYNENEREAYIKQLEHFYSEGLLDIRSIISWEDETIVARFLFDNTLNVGDLLKLRNQGAISLDYFQKLYGECMLEPSVAKETRMESFRSGIVLEDTIAEAYVNKLINRNELNELIDLGVITKNNSILKEQLHNEFLDKLNSVIDTKLYISGAKQRRLSRPSGNLRGRRYTGKNMKIINPGKREEYFSLFKAAYYTNRIKVDVESSFYDYDFYIIPDDHGEIGENSVIIAERYYKNREQQDEYVAENATYFFRCEDLVEKLTKGDTIANKRVFKVNHKLASDDENKGGIKNGSWAKNVKEAVAKTMIGSDLSEYTETQGKMIINQKLKSFYTKDELKEIDKLGEEIDFGIYNENRIVEDSQL